ncbi:MAG: response regulator [Bacillota bacterium]
MSEAFNIVVLDNTAPMRNRIKKIIDEENLSIHEAADALTFFNIINELGSKISLVITDIDLGEIDGFNIVKKLKQKNPYVPVILMTSDNRKDIFLKGIAAGVSDFILKPFEDDFFKNRIMKYISPALKEVAEINRTISKSLDQYITSEISKAKKGKYNFSVLMTTYFKPMNGLSMEQEKEYMFLSGMIYKNLNELFWITDVFIQYGTQSFIGVFPFCDQANTVKIDEKLKIRFKEMQDSDGRLSGYEIANAFVTYPEDGSSFEEIIDKLSIKMKDRIKDIKSRLK